MNIEIRKRAITTVIFLLVGIGAYLLLKPLFDLRSRNKAYERFSAMFEEEKLGCGPVSPIESPITLIRNFSHRDWVSLRPRKRLTLVTNGDNVAGFLEQIERSRVTNGDGPASRIRLSITSTVAQSFSAKVLAANLRGLRKSKGSELIYELGETGAGHFDSREGADQFYQVDPNYLPEQSLMAETTWINDWVLADEIPDTLLNDPPVERSTAIGTASYHGRKILIAHGDGVMYVRMPEMLGEGEHRFVRMGYDFRRYIDIDSGMVVWSESQVRAPTIGERELSGMDLLMREIVN
ncbi:hypothetical protein [Roseiconus lacunae]|uniref:hypothetical protein n=1 Tax=Roseiconus lacunae TaxID=2605694 RepID=UPI001E3703FA|nr:hypothetical protein [Roseiconus lacunae]MCD0458146.1 hypothetical protein [Roseiconus lacunae]